MQERFGLKPIKNNEDELTAAIYLQVSIVSQALIFVTRSRSWSFVERPGFFLVIAFCIAQLVIFTLLFHILKTKNDTTQVPQVPNFSAFLRESSSASYYTIQTSDLIFWFLNCFVKGGYTYSRVCKLGVCQNAWYWVGMGWCNMALQHHLLLTIGYSQVHYPVCVEWQGMGQFTSK